MKSWKNNEFLVGWLQPLVQKIKFVIKVKIASKIPMKILAQVALKIAIR